MGLASASAATPDCAQPHAHQAAEPDIRFAYGVGGSLHRDGNLCAAHDVSDGYSSAPFGIDNLRRAAANRSPLGHTLVCSEARNTRHGYANPWHFD